jgi:UDP-N-acetylmuramoyl-tripeptide--D-alanyl-D-alanine ligase
VLVGPDVSIDGASIDSRTIRAGQLYVPIVAERDGHAFIPAALQAGAPAYLTTQEPVGGTAIRIRDTDTALMNLGSFARDRVGGAIGITGSVGKTTTKDLLAGCLATTFASAANERSFNNELGLPLTLINAPDATQWVVLEMGARRVGDIERLASVGRPDVGIVTRVAKAHVEYFGDLDGVARAKSELVANLPASGVAILNHDDPRVRDMASRSICRVLGYAIDRDADVRAEHVTLDGDLRARFRLSTPWGHTEVRLAVHGVHQVANALAAATAALWCGVPIEAVARALAVNPGSPLRMEVHHVPNGPTLVVDCYNANPESAKAALYSLAGLSSDRKLAILGLMAELGDHSESEHRRIARLADELGIELVGYQTALYGEPHVAGIDQAVAWMRTMGNADAVLIKGSRVAGLEDVVRAYGQGREPFTTSEGSGGGGQDREDVDQVVGGGEVGCLEAECERGAQLDSGDHARPFGHERP